MTLTKSLSFSYGRKRILISDDCRNFDKFSGDFEPFMPTKRFCVEKGDKIRSNSSSSSSPIEALPQEILVKVICGVDHDDLKQLFNVSRTIRDATKIAKQSHFAYSTPSKTRAFRNSIDLLNNPMDFDIEFEAPNAPKQLRRMNRPKIDRKKLEEISIALFSDDHHDEQSQQRRPRRSLFMEIEN